jgi:hypothetical protein
MRSSSSSLRRLDRLNAGIALALAEMKGGQSLHLHYEKYGPAWRLSGGRRVDSQIAQFGTLDRNVISVGDCLFEGARANVSVD